MDHKLKHEKILIITAIAMCCCVVFYNLCFVPQVTIPTVVYVDKSTSGKTQTDNVNASEEYVAVDAVPQSDKLNINTATEAQMIDKLPGIGPTLAKRIVDYRAKYGKFSEISDLQNVSGIGVKNFDKIKSFICV